MIELLDIVIFKVDLPEENLEQGSVGTVVEILQEGNAFEVEFWTSPENTISLGLRPDQIIKMVSS